MSKPILFVVALGACTTNSTTSLSQLSSTKIEIVAQGQLNIELHVDQTQGCPTLGDDAIATFDGQRMQVSRGGYDTDSTGCYPIAFWFDELPITGITGFENVSSVSQLVVADHSQTWTINSGKLFANDFVNDTANSQVIWTDVDQITQARLDQQVTSIVGNTIHYTPGGTVTTILALAHPTPTLCDGPGTCLINLQGYRDFAASP